MRALFILFVIYLIGCSQKQVRLANTENISPAQRTLLNMVDSFKTEFSSVNSSPLKDGVVDKWQSKLHTYVRSSTIHNIKVHVDSIVLKDLTIETKFHCGRDIEFSCGLTFNEKMDQNAESLYQFMKGLKEGTDTVVYFNYINWPTIGNSADTSDPVFKIAAFPSPITK
jgi:hypothetical protein